MIAANGVTRHIQLKTKNLAGKRVSYGTSKRLADQPSGCVIVLHVDDENLKIRQYGLFAAPPGHPLPNITSYRATKHTKGDSMGRKTVRKDRWEVPKSKFDIHESVAGLYDALFGPESPDRS